MQDIGNTKEILKTLCKDLAFTHVEMVSQAELITHENFQYWLDQGYHADMNWMQQHMSAKRDPSQLLPKIQSFIVVSKKYVPKHPRGRDVYPNLKVAKYAQGEDYHHYFKKELKGLATKLKEIFPTHEFLCTTDSQPVAERELAYRAGIGWFGKNSCLISREHGSFFLLGEILTTIPCSESDRPIQDFCGTCKRCIEACPTDAIVQPKVIDSNKCISYWTIESSDIPTASLREKFSGWLFGCDICQDVCPWNQRVTENHKTQTIDRNQQISELSEILRSSNKSLQKTLRETPLSRAAGKKLKRNALIVIANERLHELNNEVAKYAEHKELGELAKWTLSKIMHT